MTTLAVTGASGKTGWRVVAEALARGWHVKAIVRPDSSLPEGLKGAAIERLVLTDSQALKAALQDCDALVIATGARPSVDLLGPLKVDALAIRDQINACRAAGVKRVVLVSSLCAGRLWHPLNLFGLILVWKRLGEQWLEQSGLSWTIVRPGGLSEDDSRAEREQIVFTGPDQQQSNSIPRQLVAQVCVDAVTSAAAESRIVEITSQVGKGDLTLMDWLAA
ncbi:MAG: SDR family oxidoreductase [Cyanobacteriota bacterium]|nr:SDR family oxidoreductase [Cyanobacteriota bacterium]